MGVSPIILPTYLLRLGYNVVQEVKLNLVHFILTKNTSSVNPPNNLDDNGKANTGATQNYIKVSTPCSNNNYVYNLHQLVSPEGRLIHATYQE